MMPIVQAIIGDIFPPAERARWAGVMMSVFGVATIIGPLIGGYITDTIGWRWTFYVNLPVGILALAFAAVALPGHVRLRRHVIDYVGAALLLAAAVPLLLGFSWAGSQYAWGSATIVGLFVFSAVAWVVFFWHEMRATEPVINPRLFTNSIFSVSAAASTLQSAAMFGAIMFLPLFVQGVMGKTATNSGIILMPMMLGAIVTSIAAGQLLARTGRYKAVVVVGFAAVTGGAFLLSRMGLGVSQFTLSRDMVIMGLGLGIAMSAFTVIVQNQYPSHRLGEVTAGLQFFRSIGSTIGLAVFGTILNNRFATQLTANMPQQLQRLTHGSSAAKLDNPQILLSAQARARLTAAFDKFGPQGHQLFKAFMDAVRHSLQVAITDLFVLATIIGAVGFVTVLFLKEAPLRRTHGVEMVEEED
jgi:EmrB/QacA subfamily drug resistance transporter